MDGPVNIKFYVVVSKCARNHFISEKDSTNV